MLRTLLLLAPLLASGVPGPSLPGLRASVPGRPASAPSPSGDSVVVFLVRHAEKSDDGSKDPPLTAAGRARAARLARVLADVGLTAVYSTDYRRTRATAEPAARAAALDVRTYDPKRPADLASRLRSTAGRYLVVGHSNTVPELVRALGGDPGPDMSEAEYDRLYVVSIGGTGVTTLRLHYGERSGGGTMGHPAGAGARAQATQG